MSNYFKSFDWVTLVMYLILVFAGWLTIHAASYNLEDPDISIFDFSRPSGKQIVWIALSVFLVVLILVTDSKFFITYAPVIYTLHFHRHEHQRIAFLDQDRGVLHPARRVR